jgi:hypothetical protein
MNALKRIEYDKCGTKRCWIVEFPFNNGKNIYLRGGDPNICSKISIAGYSLHMH